MNNIPKINLKYLIIVVISISVLIIAAALIFTFINFRMEKSPSTDVQPAALPTAENSQQITGTIKSYSNNFLQKNIILNSQGQDISFSITDATIFYKCSDFNNINSCTKTDQGISSSKVTQVFAKGDRVLFLLYKD